MKLNRLLEITNDRETCEFCPDPTWCENICTRCNKVKPITAEEMQEYYREVRKVLTENANLREKLEQEYIDGAKYAIYEIMKESDIPGSQAIRDSGGTIDMMCATVADKIRAALEENANLRGVCYDVADADQPGIQGRQEAGDAESQREIGIKHIMRRSECDNVCYTASEGLFSTAQPGVYRKEESAGTRNEEPERSGWWPAEPDVGRVAHGVSHRVDRLKCLGNAVVPAQFYPIFKGIMEVELHGR